MKRPPRSALEAKLDEVLHTLYPKHRIVSDFPIKVGPVTVLFVDRVIPSLGLAFETDGRQHSEFVRHYHGDAEGFAAHKKRDLKKEQWLHAAGYALVRIPHDAELTVPYLRARILEALAHG